MIKTLLLLAALFSSSCASALSLTIGSTAQNPPFSDIADIQGGLFGFDIDIMMEICKRIQADCKFTTMLFNEIFPQLLTQKINLGISAIIITPEREKEFLFSLPYLESNAQFVSLLQANIKDPKDIISKTIGTRRGTPFSDLAISLYGNAVKIVEYPRVANLLDALKNNDIDLILMDYSPAKYWVTNNSDIYKLVGAKIPIGDGYAVAAYKGEEALIAQINQALKNMEADGTYLQIYSRYFG